LRRYWFSALLARVAVRSSSELANKRAYVGQFIIHRILILPSTICAVEQQQQPAVANRQWMRPTVGVAAAAETPTEIPPVAGSGVSPIGGVLYKIVDGNHQQPQRLHFAV
jgi:hypothetical protein